MELLFKMAPSAEDKTVTQQIKKGEKSEEEKKEKETKDEKAKEKEEAELVINFLSSVFASFRRFLSESRMKIFVIDL